MHPVRDGAPLRLLIETPLDSRALITFLPMHTWEHFMQAIPFLIRRP